MSGVEDHSLLNASVFDKRGAVHEAGAALGFTSQPFLAVLPNISCHTRALKQNSAIERSNKFQIRSVLLRIRAKAFPLPGSTIWPQACVGGDSPHRTMWQKYTPDLAFLAEQDFAHEN